MSLCCCKMVERETKGEPVFFPLDVTGILHCSNHGTSGNLQSSSHRQCLARRKELRCGNFGDRKTDNINNTITTLFRFLVGSAACFSSSYSPLARCLFVAAARLPRSRIQRDKDWVTGGQWHPVSTKIHSRLWEAHHWCEPLQEMSWYYILFMFSIDLWFFNLPIEVPFQISTYPCWMWNTLQRSVLHDLLASKT